MPMRGTRNFTLSMMACSWWHGYRFTRCDGNLIFAQFLCQVQNDIRSRLPHLFLLVYRPREFISGACLMMAHGT